jgi:hypothetical protein
MDQYGKQLSEEGEELVAGLVASWLRTDEMTHGAYISSELVSTFAEIKTKVVHLRCHAITAATFGFVLDDAKIKLTRMGAVLEGVAQTQSLTDGCADFECTYLDAYNALFDFLNYLGEIKKMVDLNYGKEEIAARALDLGKQLLNWSMLFS